VVTNNQISIPGNSYVSIQFTGLAGAKSLEIEPPKIHVAENGKFNVKEPIRISAVSDGQLELSKTIVDTARLMLDFFGKGGLEATKSSIKKSVEITRQAENKVDKATNTVKRYNNSISDKTNVAKQFINKQNQNIDSLNKFFKSSKK